MENRWLFDGRTRIIHHVNAVFNRLLLLWLQRAQRVLCQELQLMRAVGTVSRGSL